MPVKGVRLCPEGAASKVFKQGRWHLHNRSQLGVSGRSSILCVHEGREGVDLGEAEFLHLTFTPHQAASQREVRPQTSLHSGAMGWPSGRG